MIIADISTYRVQCSDAEHFYCEFEIVPDSYPLKPTVHLSANHSDLTRKLTSESEVMSINKKDGRGSARLGQNTFKFNSISQIQETLQEQFKKQNIICYYEGKIFKEMLCIINGENKGYKFFGETFLRVPSSCFKDLIPENCIIKCEDCGKVYKIEEVTIEKKWDKRIILEFIKEKTIKSKCCNEPYLVWNVVFNQE